jgi:predicted Fe-Mo cluster-binding NifX family protein
MNVKPNGRSPTAPEDQVNAPNVKAQTSIEPPKKGDTRGDIREGSVGMDRVRLAIPCLGEANLQAQVSPHFGRCDSYAIVTLQDGKIEAVESMPNSDHTDCSSPVQALAKHNVRLMLVAGMGMRPYMSFKQHGIEVNCGVTGTVAEAVESYIKNEIIPMTEDTLCSCHDQGHHHH